MTTDSPQHNAYLEEILQFMPRDRVYTDELRTLTWGTDAGFYRLIPKIVVVTANEEEVVKLLQAATRHEIPVTFRAGGTSLSGQAITDSVLIVAARRWLDYKIGPNAETITVQLADIAAVPAGYVPLRAVVQADHGSASWYKDENQSFFYLNGVSIVTDFNDMSVSLNDEKVEEAEALLINGVTYIPVSVLENIEGVTVTDNSEGEVESYEISTPNGTPLMKLAYSVMDVAGMGMGMNNTPEELERYWGENYGFKAEFMTEGVAFLGMMTVPDSILIGKMAEGAEESLKESCEGYRKQQEETFSWYLSQNLPKVENAKFVTEGDWFLFLIAENADEAVETFRAAVQAMNETQE